MCLRLRFANYRQCRRFPGCVSDQDMLEFSDLVLAQQYADKFSWNGSGLIRSDLIVFAIATWVEVLQVGAQARVSPGVCLNEDQTLEAAAGAVTQPVHGHAWSLGRDGLESR